VKENSEPVKVFNENFDPKYFLDRKFCQRAITQFGENSNRVRSSATVEEIKESTKNTRRNTKESDVSDRESFD
jgi:hypothetical protein